MSAIHAPMFSAITGSHPVFGNIDWQPYSSQPLTWSGTSWDYDGDYGGCDGCVRGIAPSGTWAVGFVASSVSITFTSSEAWESYGDLILILNSTVGTWLNMQIAMPAGIKPAGTHTITYPVVHDGGDLTSVRLWLGYGDGPNSDRSFQITNISFT